MDALSSILLQGPPYELRTDPLPVAAFGHCEGMDIGLPPYRFEYWVRVKGEAGTEEHFDDMERKTILSA